MAAISPTSAVGATAAVINDVSGARQGSLGEAVSISVLKQGLQQQAQSTATLLASVQSPPLATEGPLGTQVNTYA